MNANRHRTRTTHRKGITESVTVLAAVILALLGGAFLLFILTNGINEAMTQLGDAADNIQSEIGERTDHLRTVLANALQAPSDQDQDQDQDTPEDDTTSSKDDTSSKKRQKQ